MFIAKIAKLSQKWLTKINFILEKCHNALAHLYFNYVIRKHVKEDYVII